MLPDRAENVDPAGNGHVEPDPAMPGHRGHVAGRHRDGGLTGAAIDVRLHVDGRYLAYVPRCECGWTGPPFSATANGFAACRQLWRTKHLELFLRAGEPRSGWWHPTVIRGQMLG